MLEAEIIARFLNVNRALLNQVDCTMSGSTCTLALVLPDGSGNKTMVFANLGDSRAVIGARRSENSPLVSIDATIDHKPGIPAERKRITDSGGWVGVIDQMQKRIMLLEDSVDEGYDGQNIHFNAEFIDSDSNPSFAYHNDILRKTARVFIPGSNLPGLAVSRSFGDEAVGHLGVTSSPEVTFLSCSPAHKFIILATDGLWEVLTSQESVEIVGQHADADGGARALLDVASHRWQNRPPYVYRDDITVMIVQLP
ncbi:hypothetical protein GUITHDRAFT_84969 [Guillardia theta CCMP2712]|uniref:PPM-type phosphatase domain-containing protein n=1 Tax=Guillardia theta (strain CCMP2712) TaxID=905079 RepID=L1JTK1_GUITC|nr:hypothetical protein GUITHDRAFT_84969 [Guillardia theta CCMP2712]EKX51403.1 hypothetical protein GUITHDRAFT_84969 [Guillardia theta CCMP2712]|eukprot:XP_005838383.1 hypothetical protein GUITHDRAFT_84969 [Guillardia theta CCMP2712]